ncbi:unnamed protein product [Brugia timori]|uniref:Uncharacterized protein n=1 Tax=Brugia timori TaxID=42155 RepID=A0A3P7TU45_9BILA|nr:unnamed protein product [Brugia timori]
MDFSIGNDELNLRARHIILLIAKRGNFPSNALLNK